MEQKHSDVMGKSKKKITNWNEYNEALCKRGSVTFWIDDSAVKAWQCKNTMANVKAMNKVLIKKVITVTKELDTH